MLKALRVMPHYVKGAASWMGGAVPEGGIPQGTPEAFFNAVMAEATSLLYGKFFMANAAFLPVHTVTGIVTSRL